MQRLLLAFTILLGGCTGIPDGLAPVADFELQRYLGTWYEIARLDHSFERGMSNVTATYSLRDDGSGAGDGNRTHVSGSTPLAESIT